MFQQNTAVLAWQRSQGQIPSLRLRINNMSKIHLSQAADPETHRDLGRQYRAIGIGAVAAALPYRGEVKNGAYAPVRPRVTKPITADVRMRRPSASVRP